MNDDTVGSGNDDQMDDQVNDPDEERRRKFREALDRKRERSRSGQQGAEDQTGKAHHASGPARAQRTFRRKSG